MKQHKRSRAKGGTPVGRGGPKAIFRRVLLIAGTSAIAWMAGSHAVADITASRNANLALQFNPNHPEALTAKAELLFSTGREEGAAVAAQDAIVNTPLASEAFQLLAVSKSVSASNADAEALFKYSERLDRRNIPAQIWLFQNGLLGGRVDAALRHMDAAMRVSQSSRDTLYPMLASALAADALVDPVKEIFLRDPVWLPGFLNYAIGNRASLSNLARIVASLPEDSSGRRTSTDGALLRALVATGEYGEARAFMGAITPMSADQTVRDGSFTINGPYEPYDWKYSTSGALAASPTGAASGGLQYRAATNQGGRVVAQLLDLDPGSYRLVSDAEISLSQDDGFASWAIRCADTPALELADVPIRNRSRGTGPVHVEAVFEVPLSGCRDQWLDLNIQATFAPGGVEGVIKNVRIEPVERRPVVPDAP